MASRVASRLPVSWEERLGQAALESLAPIHERCSDPALSKGLDPILAKLTASLAASPYTYRVVVLDSPHVNAFAVPGGTIVILRGLVKNTKTAEELAGVLAHEIQHIEMRHTMRALLQDASTGFLIAAISGDAGGAMGHGLEAARTLGGLRYSRESEEEADREGMRLLIKTGIDPEGMIRFFERLEAEERGLPDPLQYLSTHPMARDRIKTLKSIAAASSRRYPKLLPGFDWKGMGQTCLAF
jgi:predicted Zn-dependent protease